MSSNKEAPIYNNYSIQGLSKCMKKKLYHLLSYKTCCVNTKIRAINNVHLASNSTISIPHNYYLVHIILTHRCYWDKSVQGGEKKLLVEIRNTSQLKSPAAAFCSRVWRFSEFFSVSYTASSSTKLFKKHIVSGKHWGSPWRISKSSVLLDYKERNVRISTKQASKLYKQTKNCYKKEKLTSSLGSCSQSFGKSVIH